MTREKTEPQQKMTLLKALQQDQLQFFCVALLLLKNSKTKVYVVLEDGLVVGLNSLAYLENYNPWY